MGSFDGAETYDSIGVYILSKLKDLDTNLGLYRDDGLVVTCKTRRQADILKKKICNVFNDLGLRVTIDVNSKVVDFLDVTLDLNSGLHKPYIKPNNSLLYVDRQSNHPPSITKNIPSNINKRLSSLSSNEEIFNQAKAPYQEALQKSGYTYSLKFEPPTIPQPPLLP